MPKKKRRKLSPVDRSGPPTAIIYCRVSTTEQAKNHSLGTQERQCREYCDREGWAVLEVVREEGEYGGTADRPDFQRVITRCRERRDVHFLVVADLTRFMRNAEEHYVVRAELAHAGVKLRSATQPIDETPEGLLSEGIAAVFAEYDNNKRRHKTTVGMIASLLKRRWPFQAPIGYRKTRAMDGHPTLEADPRTASEIRKAFEQIASGVSRRQVLADLRLAGIRGQRGARFSTQTFGEMLRNKLYVGILAVADWNVEIQGKYVPIVSKEVFDDVQARLAGKSPTGSRRLRQNPRFPLRGTVKCVCGEVMTANVSKGRSKRYEYYRCRQCAEMNVRADDVVAAFKDLLRQQKAADPFRALVRAAIEDESNRERAQHRGRLGDLRQQRSQLDNRVHRLMDLLLDGKLQEDRWAAEDARLRVELGEIDSQIRQLSGGENDLTATLDFAEDLMSDAAEWWRRLPIEHQQELQSLIFPSGVIYADGVCRTAGEPLFSGLYSAFNAESVRLVDLTGFEPVTS